MLRLYIKEGREWREVENGPFPISADQLSEARTRFAAEWKAAEPMTGARQSPQTTARAILAEVAPKLSAFDALMIGFAVTSKRVSAQDESGNSVAEFAVPYPKPCES